MHRLLERQIRKYIGNDIDTMPFNLDNFIAAVNDAYTQFDSDRLMTERSLELMSRELTDRNNALRQELKERKNIVDALKDNQRRTRGIVDAAADSIISVSADGQIMSFNPASEKIFGYMAKEVIGREINILIPPNTQNEHSEYLRHYLSTRKSSVVYGVMREIPAVRKNGETFFLELAISELDFGYERMFIMVSRDISRRKEIEQALEKAHDEAVEANQVKSEFLAGISHELRTPLNAIIGFSDMLLKEIDGPMNDEQKNSVQFIFKSGKNLLALINDILDMSKIQAGKMEVTLEKVDIRAVIEDSLENVSILFKEKGLQLKMDATSELPEIQADPMRVQQIMLNLLSNAAKFTDEGIVRVRCNQIKIGDPGLPEDKTIGLPVGSQWIMIAVQDNGVGIANSNIPKVFEEFRQVEGGVSRRQGGTGLGVPISKRFVELHGGRMWLTSEEGHGTTFYFILPVVIDIKESKIPSDMNDPELVEYNPVDKNSRHKMKVLIVEDDAAVATLCRKFLVKADYRVDSVMHGSKVIDKVKEYKPDIILLDIMLPGKDGWQILDEMKTSSEMANIPVVIVSAMDERQFGLSLGAAEYLVKPVEEELLINSLNRIINDHRIILIIDNTYDLIESTRTSFNESPYRIYSAKDSRESLELIRDKKPDLILLNWDIPKHDGIALLETMKMDASLYNIPLIVITGQLLGQAKKAFRELHATILQKDSYSDQDLGSLIADKLKKEVLEEA